MGAEPPLAKSDLFDFSKAEYSENLKVHTIKYPPRSEIYPPPPTPSVCTYHRSGGFVAEVGGSAGTSWGHTSQQRILPSPSVFECFAIC